MFRTIAQKGWILLALLAPVAQAQLANNISIGNPVAVAMANAVTARPPGTDAIHFNPAGLAQVKHELNQYKLQLAFTRLEGTVSGRAPGEPYGAIEDDAFSQDPLMQGQQTRKVEASAINVYLPFFGHVELPFGVGPGYGMAIRSNSHNYVFANSALLVSAAGFRRDPDNVGAYGGEKVGQTTLGYFNPTFAFSVTDSLDAGFSVGFNWVGLGLHTQIRSVVHTLALANQLLDLIDSSGNLNVSISPYSDVGWLDLQMEDVLVPTATLGLLWRPEQWLSVGVTYRTGATAKLKGEYHVRYKEDFLRTLQTLKPASGAFHLLDGTRLEAAPNQSGDARSELNLPQQLSVGVSTLVTPQWRVNLDVRWIDYSVVRQVDTYYENALDYLTIASMVNHLAKDRIDGFDWADPKVSRTRRHFSDVIDWALGMEYYYDHRLTLRFGIEPRTSPIAEEWMELSQPLGDAWFFGTGFGLKLANNSQLDVGIGYMKSDIDLAPGESRVSNSLVEGETNSLYYRGLHIKHTTEMLMLSVGYLKHF